VSSTVPGIHLGATVLHQPDADVRGGFATIDGERYARIGNVDGMPPFLMNVVSDGDMWLFAGSNGPFTAGRRSPDMALFPYRTSDKILEHADSGGMLTILLVTRDGQTSLWEPWRDCERTYEITRNLYRSVTGTSLVFEEINQDLGLSFRVTLAGCDEFGLVREAVLENLVGQPAQVRYLDGWHELIPPGVTQEIHARLSYLATGYMRHERVPGSPLAIYTLNTAISDRPEPSESLRAAAAWSVGHGDPVILLSSRQVGVFRRGDPVRAEDEVRGAIGAYLVADSVGLEGGARHRWSTVGDTGLDHASLEELRCRLAEPGQLARSLRDSVAASRDGILRRVAGADALQRTADEAATAHHVASVLYNAMRGGTFDGSYRVPTGDLADYLLAQDRVVHARHQAWLAGLPATIDLDELRGQTAARRDPHLSRLIRMYLPLTFSRRHGDPSRPWNRFTIRLRDERGRPIYAYQGNWRDIFQNWEALGRSYPGYLESFVAVFLNASSADGYNPYRITRDGADWEIPDERDPWSHIGYWGDHQIVYLHRLLESLERHSPGLLAAMLGELAYAYTRVPYEIAGFDDLLADPRASIHFNTALHQDLVARTSDVGADGKLFRDEDGDVRLVSLCEKLLVPLLTKLTNLVPGGGIWMNTQRPEWNDANNALAGWGLSVVTVASIRRYLTLLAEILPEEGSAPVSGSVVRLVEQVSTALVDGRDAADDEARFRVMTALGRAGEEHRAAVYAGQLGPREPLPFAAMRRLVDLAMGAIESTLRASRRPDGLYHSYNVLSVNKGQASIARLDPMLEGQVAVLDSGLLGDGEALALLRSLRASDLYREDQGTFMLYPDRQLVPYLERNTLAGLPPVQDARLFTADRHGRWHFQADLSTLADVEDRLQSTEADEATKDAVVELWRTTFSHRSFTGRSDRFFMFEGLGSIFWHMVSKFLLAVQATHRQAADPAVAADIARFYAEARLGVGTHKSPAVFGAFPMDPYSHSPRHMGAQQPGMTGQAKEDILCRFGELGVEVQDGCLHFEPRLLARAEFLEAPQRFDFLALDGRAATWELSARSLAFTYCQVPICYRLGAVPSIEVEYVDGHTRTVGGSSLDRESSLAIFERRGTIRRLTVTVPEVFTAA
jgi:hypothetical protein